MEEVKISFNNQTWSDDGAYYRGRFIMSKKLFDDFINHLKKEHEKVAKKSR